MIRASPINQIVPSGTKTAVRAVLHQYVLQYTALIVRHATKHATTCKRRTVQETDVQAAVQLVRGSLPAAPQDESTKYMVSKAVREAFKPLNVSPGALKVLDDDIRIFVHRLKERLHSSVFADPSQARRISTDDVIVILKQSDGFTEYGTPAFVYRDKQ